jgi:beta-galactosidase
MNPSPSTQPPAFYDTLIAQLLKDADIHPVVTPPPGVEVALRQSPNKKLLFLINHTEEPKTVNVPKDKTDLLSGQKTSNVLTLVRFDVAVVEL